MMLPSRAPVVVMCPVACAVPAQVQYGDYTELLDYESADSFLLFQTWKQSMERSGAAIKRASTIPSQVSHMRSDEV